ncbi:MAG: phosphodiester glycosidase family protein [Prevotellaceae bacterium]|jgi:exopolysaccharide biosynthesis protein|nr:phosphodiester glycosidase family protein [Prevotellaceae bacterium]
MKQLQITRLLPFLLLLLCAVPAAAQTAADSVKIVTADWHVTTLHKDMTCYEARFDTLYGLPQSIAILELSPRTYRFDVEVHIPRETVAAAAHELGAVAAINGGFFKEDGSSSTYLRKNGIVLDTTVTTKLSTVVNGAIQIRRDRIDITPWTRYSADTCSLAGGTVLVAGPLLLQGGHNYSFATVYNQAFVNARHPRSAMANKANGNILLVVASGRLPGYAEGVNLPQLQHLLRILGGKDAINLDGGGSSTLWSLFAPDNGVLNQPSDNKLYDSHGARKVGNSICVYDE